MTDELGARARALLDAARDGLSPDAAAVRRVRSRLAALGGGGAAAGTALAVKLGVIAVVAALATIAGVVVYTRGPAPGISAATGHRATEAPAPVAPRPELASPPEVPPEAATRAPSTSDDDQITIETPPPVASGRGDAPAAGSPAVPRSALPGRAPAAPRSATAAAPALVRPARATVSLAREVELLDLAMAALRRSDPTGALRAVKQHTAETAGRGQLAEDAAAIEIEALCHLDDPTTHAKLEAFDARFPRSAQRSRLCVR